MISRATRGNLLASTIIAGAVAAAAPAFAQATGTTTGQTSTPSGEQTAASAGPAEPTSQGHIVVTGSLIKNPALASPNPAQVLGQEEVQLRQTNTAEEVLRDLPGAVPSIGSAVNNGSPGFSFVNLRGLGSNRNLVLLDGNRIAPADLRGVVDLNDIPLALIQRTEVLTGGASTTYGADAISGVVNFITRNDFSGVEATVSKQITGQGDGAYYRADITIGANFDDGKGNAVFSIGYQHADPVYQGDRPFGAYDIGSYSGDAAGSGTTSPTRFLGIPGIGTLQINPATGTLVKSYSFPSGVAFNFNPYNVYQTPFERFNIYGAGHYDISDDLTVYTRGMYSKNTVETIQAPGGAFNPLAVVIPFSNPYLPAPARAQFCGAYGLTTAQCNAAAIATSPADPNYRTFALSIARRALELGPRTDTYVTNHFDYRLGLRGNITSNIHFDINGSYGESDQFHTETGYFITTNVQQALLATNTATCLNNSGGCVPLNVFGPVGSITPAMLNYLTTSTFEEIRTSLGQARAVINGDFGYHSPFATDAINFAVGAEYRKYRASLADDVLTRTGNLSGDFPIPPIAGGYDVTEGFGEVIAPLVQDKPFMQALELTGGIRYSHYNIETQPSRSFNTTTWKGGFTYQPVSAVKFRGVYQHAVRAPNISELFSPVTTNITSLSFDPCAGAAPTQSANLRAICIAQGASPAAIGLIDAPSAGQVNSTVGGNPNLKPEKSNSYTAGIVLQPKRIVPGLSITVDYYHIKITKAISTASPGDAINGCFGFNATDPASIPANAASPACTSIRRDFATGQLIGDTVGGLPLTISNQGKFLTDGVDLGANYRRDLGIAILNLSFQGNWTRRSKFQATPVSVYRECVGYYSTNCSPGGGLEGGSIQPKFTWNQRTTVTYHKVDLSLLWRHIDHMRQEPADIGVNGPAFVGTFTNPLLGSLVGKQVNEGRIPAYNYLDLSARVSAGEHVEFTVTVQNLLDKKPPIIGGDIGSALFDSGNTYPSTYDTLGRRFAVGARLKF